eukprot:m.131922 g.131922  ORF g.131922 m.131922 type:complete len:418 (+) comp17486_c0_seq1:170-1423(+)
MSELVTSVGSTSSSDDEGDVKSGIEAFVGTPEKRQSRSQISDTQRKLSYRMQAVGQATGKMWSTLKNSVVKEDDLLEEKALMERLHEYTGEAFIGAATEITLQRDDDDTFGFKIGSSGNLRGARVARVSGDGPAAAAGVEVGDIIVSIGGRNALGLEHCDVVKMITESEGNTLQLSVASPLGAHQPLNEMTNCKAERPKPPSYVVIRNKLVDEFGEETYQKCKRRVQDHMTSLSNEYNKMAGIPITSKSEILRCYANSKVVQMQESGKWWKNWAKFKIATLRGTAGTDGASKSSIPKVDLTGGDDEDVFAFETNQNIDDDLDLMDGDALAATRDRGSDLRLQERLQEILESHNPPAECRAAIIGHTDAISEDDILPQLSYAGVRSLLLKEYGEVCFTRNVAYVQGKLQEREMMMISL